MGDACQGLIIVKSQRLLGQIRFTLTCTSVRHKCCGRLGTASVFSNVFLNFASIPRTTVWHNNYDGGVEVGNSVGVSVGISVGDSVGVSVGNSGGSGVLVGGSIKIVGVAVGTVGMGRLRLRVTRFSTSALSPIRVNRNVMIPFGTLDKFHE